MDYKPEIETYAPEPDIGRAIEKIAREPAKDILNQVASIVQEFGKDDSKDTPKIPLLERAIQVQPLLQNFERVLSEDSFYLLSTLQNDRQLIDFVVRTNLIKVHPKRTSPTKSDGVVLEGGFES